MRNIWLKRRLYTADFGRLYRSSVVASIKPSELSVIERITAIHTLDEKVSSWWHKLRSAFKLTPSNIAAAPDDVLPNLMLLNVVYHQCICSLHASIVPLFCLAVGDNRWASIRKLSAQKAFEHACATSALIDAVLSAYSRPTAMPTFVAYAAYCGCAVQIPFMWSSNLAVREGAHKNVRANIRMIDTLANYWKFAALLVSSIRIPEQQWTN